MSVGASVSVRRGPQADGIGFLDPLPDAKFIAVHPGLAFNYGEFAGIKIGVVDGLPDADKWVMGVMNVAREMVRDDTVLASFTSW